MFVNVRLMREGIVEHIVSILYHSVFWEFFYERGYKCCRINVYRHFMFSLVFKICRFFQHKIKKENFYRSLWNLFFLSCSFVFAQSLQYRTGAFGLANTSLPHSLHVTNRPPFLR